MESKKVYVLRNMEGLTDSQVIEIENKLTKLGYTVINPLKNENNKHLEEISDSDVDYVLKVGNDTDSSFSKKVLATAKERGIPVIYFKGEILVGSGRELMLKTLSSLSQRGTIYIRDSIDSK